MKTYYSGDQIQEEFTRLPNHQKIEVLYEALDFMQQYNGRTRFMCVALAMGYENPEGEYDTYVKK